MEIAYYLIKRSEPYGEMGADYLDKRRPEASEAPDQMAGEFGLSHRGGKKHHLRFDDHDLQISQSTYGVFMGIASMHAVLSGALMYWRVSGGLQSVWLATSSGIVLTIGARAAILALALGMTVHSPTGARPAGLGKEIGAAGAASTPVRAQALGHIQARIAKANGRSVVLLIAATIGMPIAPYA